MNTLGHVVINLAVFARRNQPERNAAVGIGAFMPDAPIFVLYAVERFMFGTPDRLIWSQRYFLSSWQNFIDLFNSLPLMAIGWFVACWRHSPRVALCFLSMGVHALCDLPLHGDDAHRHFYPFHSYRFESPISYWDPARFGAAVSLVESVLAIAASVYTRRLVETKMGKVGVVLIGLSYAAFIVVRMLEIRCLG